MTKEVTLRELTTEELTMVRGGGLGDWVKVGCAWLGVAAGSTAAAAAFTWYVICSEEWEYYSTHPEAMKQLEAWFNAGGQG